MAEADSIRLHYGFSESEWLELSDEDRGKITGQSWTMKLCVGQNPTSIPGVLHRCNKPVAVLSTHAGDTWCGEHAGTWKDRK